MEYRRSAVAGDLPQQQHDTHQAWTPLAAAFWRAPRALLRPLRWAGELKNGHAVHECAVVVAVTLH